MLFINGIVWLDEKIKLGSSLLIIWFVYLLILGKVSSLHCTGKAEGEGSLVEFIIKESSARKSIDSTRYWLISRWNTRCSSYDMKELIDGLRLIGEIKVVHSF